MIDSHVGWGINYISNRYTLAGTLKGKSQEISDKGYVKLCTPLTSQIQLSLDRVLHLEATASLRSTKRTSIFSPDILTFRR